MAQNLLAHIRIEPAGTPRATVIWLHGLGADGFDFVPVAKEMALDDIRYVFPHAPQMPVTINGGARMPAWYDIKDFQATEGRADPTGVKQSAAAVTAFIEAEIDAGINTIYLAGFSQGGAIALHAGLLAKHPIAGILALSTYVPIPSAITVESVAPRKNTPILMAHGTQDPVVPLQLAELGRTHLTDHGLDITWKTYPMPHSVCEAEIRDIKAFLSP